MLLKRHRLWAMWLVVAALFVKVAVPAGYMPVRSGGTIAVAPCSGFGPETMAMTMASGTDDRHARHDRSDRSDAPCGFAGHAAPSMAGADPILLALAIAFIVATPFRMPVARLCRRIAHLRPHPRGPPAIR